MVKNLLKSAVLKLVLKLPTDVDFTIASDRLFQTSTILQLKNTSKQQCKQRCSKYPTFTFTFSLHSIRLVTPVCTRAVIDPL